MPDTAAGKNRLCPKCNLMFRVPVPPTVADKPLPEAQLLDESTPFPEPVDTRPAPRPIYKQHRDTPPSESMSAESRSGGRKKRRKRIAEKRNHYSPGILIGVGILVLAIFAGFVFFAARIAEEPAGPKPLFPIEDPKPAPTEGPVIPVEPTSVDIPKTWSINAPSFGFRAAWPVPPGQLGYCPIESLTVGYNGLKPNTWAFTESGQRIIMTVSVVDLPDESEIDAEATLDRHVEILRRKAPRIGVTPMAIAGVPARQISFVADGDRSISRVVFKGGRLWTVSVVCPQTVSAEDPKVVRFLNAFQPL